MSAEVIEMWPKPEPSGWVEYLEYCQVEGCDSPADHEYGIQFSGYDIDGQLRLIESALCRAHGLAFELVREVKK